MKRTSRALEATSRPPGRAPADAGGRSGATRLPFADLPPRILLLIVLLATTGCATASADGDDEYRDGHSFSGVERIVAIGDIHGDWDGYIATLQAAGLIDDRDRWSGGETHLVQTGDLPDRGPDTRRIIEHMAQLARQARRAGGRVHNLMGNHEAMNVYGDLRYVTPGEFEAWADRRSARLRDRYYEELMGRMRESDPEAFEALPDDHREQWNAEHPEGWLEHRYAWSPLWDDDGPMYEWVRDQRVAVRINDLVFLHGGISTVYCRDALPDWTERAQDALDARSQEELDILVDPLGPLWYRGLSGVEPTAPMNAVEAILARYEVNHIVVGHTPTGGVIWPRYGGRVIQIDTGIGAYYGSHVGYLEITDAGRFAGYRNGKVRLPEIDADRNEYVREVLELLGDQPQLAERLTELQQEGTSMAESQSAAPDAAPEPVSCDRPR